MAHLPHWFLNLVRLSILAELYAAKGYTCLDVDLSLSPDATSTSPKLMEYFESGMSSDFPRLKTDENFSAIELDSIVRMSFIPFPPVIIARGVACLITQTYISSHPASGVVLISPPPCNTMVPRNLLPTPLPEFDFEPKFPICVVATGEDMQILQRHNRLVKDQAADVIVVKNVDGQEAFTKIEQWLDEIGI